MNSDLNSVQVQLPPKLIPVFTGPALYRGAYGGRGAGKTRSFAKMIAVKGYILDQAGEHGTMVCGREFMNSLSDSSFSEVQDAIRSEPWLLEAYELGDTYIRTKSHNIEFAFVGLRHSLDSIKSKARIWVLWVDEAERVSETAWAKADNTVREDGAETWATWNPERKGSATDLRWRKSPPPESKVVEINWQDNPWFTDTLEKKRLQDMAARPEQYAHVWEGDYVTVVSGAYYAKELTLARTQGRIGKVPADPFMVHRLFADIGGTGARADNFVFWDAQFVDREIRILNHYERQGQSIGYHLGWLRENNLTPANAKIWLPHDGDTQEKTIDWSFKKAFEEAQYEVVVVPNQGRGAAKLRVEAVKRLFPAIWFNEATTQGGRDALGWYHEKIDEDRGIGLGPEHDWSSHASDAFGLMAVVYERPNERPMDMPQPDNRWVA